MLTLSRRRGEKIMIGDNVELTVTEITRGKVKLAFVADRSIPIWRKELLTGERQDDPILYEETTPDGRFVNPIRKDNQNESDPQERV